MSKDPDYGYSGSDHEDALRGPEPQGVNPALVLAGVLTSVGILLTTILMQKRIKNPAKP